MCWRTQACVRVSPYLHSLTQPLSFPEKGPAVCIDNARPFLDKFYSSALVNLLRITDKGGWVITPKDRSIFTNVSRSFGDTLTSLSDASRDELAKCDVVWWTRLCLANIPFESDSFGKGFVYGMYCGIHACIVSLHKFMVGRVSNGNATSASRVSLQFPSQRLVTRPVLTGGRVF